MGKKHYAHWSPAGGRSEWQEYRHGEKRPVYAPGKDPIVKRVIDGDKRKHVVGKVVEQLEGWTSTPFEHEGSTRAGLRSGLCLNGLRWPLADLVAADLVASALREMGAQRPSFEQGQPEYVHELIYCAHCSRELGEDDVSANRARRYCSVECAKAAMAKQSMRHREKNDKFKRSAQAIVYQAKIAERTCVECGGSFRPQSEGKAQKFCSQRCAGASNQKAMAAQGVPCVCTFCGGAYMAGNHKSRHCSTACYKADAKLKAGQKPRQLTRPLFDHFFTQPNNASRPVWLTPDRFDQMMAG